jgi:hypothetical protein
VGTGTLTGTLDYDDHTVTWWIGGKGAIAIDDIQITDVATGQVIASEDAEPGTALLSTFFVSADKPSFVWGEAVKVTAALYDETGKARSAGPVTWSVNPAGAATVAADGTVTPRALRTFTVRGTAAGKSGEVKLQARPKRIVVIPEAPAMIVGSRQKLRAEVLDLNDKPIAGAAVEWAVGNQSGTFTRSATIDASGMLDGLLQARVRAIARIRYPDAVPGFSSQSQGDALVDIKAPATYRFERIWVAKPSGAATSTLAPLPAQLVPTESGFLFAASLDGLGGALLEWNGGEVKPVLASGRLHVQSGLPLTDITGYTRNSSGETLTHELDAAGGPIVSGGPAGQITPMYTYGLTLFGADNVGGFTITRNSLADSGAIAVRAGFTDSVTGKRGQGIFRGYGRWLSEAAVTTIDERLDPADVPTGLNFFGIAGDGTVWFVTCCNRPGSLWRSRPGAAPEKMLAAGTPLGDAIANSTPDNYTGAPTLFVASNGDVVIAANTNRGFRWVLWRDGESAPSEFLNASAGRSVFWYHPAVGALLDTTVTGRSRGLYLWNRGDARLLLAVNDTSLDGSPVEEILSATCTSSGTIYAMVRTSENPMLIARLEPNKEVLLKAGDSVPVTAPPVISALIPGARTGTPLVLAGGQTGSIARLDESGGVTPVVRLGERLPDRKFYVGSKLSQVRALPDGRIVFGENRFAWESGMYTWNEGKVGLTMPAPLTDPAGLRSGYVNALEVNRKGDVFVWTSFANAILFQIRDGRAAHVLSVPFTADGLAFSGVDLASLAVDESGRATFSATASRPGAHLVQTDGTYARLILSPDSRTPDGRSVPGIGRIRGCSGGVVAGALGTYFQFRDGAWQYLADRAERLASGGEADRLSSNVMDVNYNCDVAFHDGNQGNGSIGARRNSKYHQFQNLDDLTPDGDLLRVVQVLMNDDGTVFVLGANDRGEEVIYRATPL